MFTGIVAEIGNVVSAPSGSLVIVARDVIRGMTLGGSIAVNGACLTATDFDDKSFSVDIMPETVKKTNLGLLLTGDKVNLERPLALNGELGGHLVQGHVDDTGRVASIIRHGESRLIRFETSPEVLRYTVPKGFITVDGASLTIVSTDASSFSVSLVGYTLEHTTLGDRQTGDLVNLEVDIIAKYVERISQAHRPGITMDFLQEHGFLVS